MKEKFRSKSGISCQDNPSVIGKASTAGITLVALVVTIVVLLILAGITLVYVFGDNSVFKQASEAKLETKLGKIEEQAGTIYAEKFIDKQSGKIENISNREIAEELKSKGNPIEIRGAGVGSVTKISLEPTTVSMDQSQTSTVKVKLEVSDDENLYYAVIDGKYYKMNFSNGLLAIEREASDPEGNNEELVNIEIETGYDTTLVTKAEINQSEKTIELTSGAKFGNTELTVKYGSKTATCKITVEDEIDKLWAEIAEMAKVIAKDSKITNSSTEATSTVNGTSKTIKVGDIYKVKYDGEIRRVRVLGFKHDDLVDQEIYGSGITATKASISFEFYDLITGSSNMSMNISDNNTGGWAATQMRKDLNGYITDSEIQSRVLGGLGGKLSNQSYIKQVKKQYIKTYNDASTNQNYTNDYLWLLANSEIVSKNSSTNTNYGYAITNEGNQYKYYQGVTEAWNASSKNRVKYDRLGIGCHWWLRSPYYDDRFYFCAVHAGGMVNYAEASSNHGVAPGFAI